MEWLFLLLFVFIGLLILVNEKRKMASEKLIRDIQSQYDLLKDIVISSYDVKACPKCFEKKMSLFRVSETGQSIEYNCDHCKKKIIGKLLPDQDGLIAVEKLNEIKGLLIALRKKSGSSYSNRDIDISFFVKTSFYNVIERRQRTPIPEAIRNEVWRRDQGKCCTCGSQINLEFDHIIPFSNGGSNTARNLQLLCEACNRSKHNKI